jgi:hypothetical protein
LYLRFTTCDYPFGILDLRLVIIPLVSSNFSRMHIKNDSIFNNISIDKKICIGYALHSKGVYKERLLKQHFDRFLELSF